MDALVQSERRVEVPFRFGLVAFIEAQVTLPKDAVGLAEHLADAAIERQGFLVARPRRVMLERSNAMSPTLQMQWASPSTLPTRR